MLVNRLNINDTHSCSLMKLPRQLPAERESMISEHDGLKTLILPASVINSLCCCLIHAGGVMLNVC